MLCHLGASKSHHQGSIEGFYIRVTITIRVLYMGYYKGSISRLLLLQGLHVRVTVRALGFGVKGSVYPKKRYNVASSRA